MSETTEGAIPAPGPSPAAPVPEPKPATVWELYRRPLIILGLHFLVFTLARLALYVAHHGDFTSLTAGQVLWAFVRGLRFDASMIFTVIGAPLFLMTLPFGWARSRWWQGIWGWACYAALVVFIFILVADTVYFGFVHRHIAREATMLEENLDQTALLAVRAWWWAILLFIGAVAAGAWGWHRMLRTPHPPVRLRAWQVAVMLLALYPMYVAARGTAWGKRLKIIDAFAGATPSGAYLALNGPFAAMHSADSKSLRVDFYPEEEALRVAKELLFAPGDEPADPAYPLVRKAAASGKGTPNVVLVMFESWEAYHCDVYRKLMGLPPLGCTPNFDRMAAEGVMFTRFYAVGQKSIDGLCALNSAFPSLPRTPYLGRGLEQGRLSYIARAAPAGVYESYFLQTEKRNSFRADQIASLAGYTSFQGGEDIPLAEPCGRTLTCGAAWDREMWEEALRKLNGAKKPFLAFLYTGSTHASYTWPDPSWEKFPVDSLEHRYCNALTYADAMFGKFIEQAKAQGWYDKTIWILTADHIAGWGGTNEDPGTLHRVPGVVVAPGLKPRIDDRVGSQLDVIPTIIDLAGWGSTHASLGRSLFDDTAGPTRGAICVEGEIVVRIEAEGWVTHDLKGRLSSGGKDVDAIEKRLLSVLQAGVSLLAKNRLFPER